jgi:glycosyltransferase involved in cell wall biosynthesis
MKICHIINLYEPYMIGGAEKYVERIAQALSLSDDVMVITTGPYFRGVQQHTNAITLFRYNPLNLYNTYYAARKNAYIKPLWHLIDLWNPHSFEVLNRIFIKEKPDVVHTHNLGGISLSAFSAIRAHGIPHIHTVHDFSFICPRATLLRSDETLCSSPSPLCKIYANAKKILAGSPDIVTAPSDFALNTHVERGFFSHSLLRMLPLGIDVHEKPDPNKTYDTIHFLYVGRITRDKGVHILLQAFREIDNQNIRLHIVGKGPALGFCQELAGSDKRITFHGFVSTEVLDSIYRSAHALIVPSIWFDNSPTVIYEAMSFGLPVIGSRVGGIPELIEHGNTGFLFQSGGREELRLILETLIQDPDNLRRLSWNAYQGSRLYTLDNHLDQLKSLYREIST